MADFTGSKENFASQMISASRTLLTVIEDMDALNAAFSVHGFNDGGANEYQDADFNVNNKHLTAAIVFDVMFSIGTILGEVDTGQRNALRECIPGGLP
jgi:hypothetical protein